MSGPIIRFAEGSGMEVAYAVVLEPESIGGFSVSVPALPEVATQGRDVSDALRNAKEAIELALEYRKEQGEEIPPSDADSARMERVAVSLGAA